MHPQPEQNQFNSNIAKPANDKEQPMVKNHGYLYKDGLGLASLKDKITDPNIRRTLDNKYLLIRTIG